MINYSIIIPNYNSFNLLSRCLDSIPEREDIEVIIVDDNSDSNQFLDFLEKTKEKKNIFVYKLSINQGAGACRNFGINKAKGRWLVFSDADDKFSNTAFSSFDKYVDCDSDIVYFDAEIINSGNLNISQTTSTFNINKYLLKGNSKGLISTNWEPWGKLFNSNFIKQNNILFHVTRVMNDAYFTIHAGLQSQKIDACKDIVYQYYVYDNSISRQKNYEKDLIRFQEILLINKLFLSHKGYFFRTIDIFVPFLKLWVKKRKALVKVVKEIGLYVGIPIYCVVNKFKRKFNGK